MLYDSHHDKNKISNCAFGIGGEKITGAIPGHVVLSMCLLFSCAGKNNLAENPHAPELPDLLIHLYLSE